MKPHSVYLCLLLFFIFNVSFAQRISMEQIILDIPVDSLVKRKVPKDSIKKLIYFYELECKYSQIADTRAGENLNKIRQLGKILKRPETASFLNYFTGKLRLREYKLPEALTELRSALRGFQSQKDTMGMIFTYNELTRLHTNSSMDPFRNMDKAFAYAKTSNNLAKSWGNIQGLIMSYSSLILVYGNEPINPKLFRQVVEKQWKLLQKLPYRTDSKLIYLTNLIIYYSIIGDEKMSNKIGSQLSQLPESNYENKFKYLAVNHNIAIQNLKNKNYNQASLGFKKVISQSNNKEHILLKEDAYQGLREAYRGLGDYKKALEFADSSAFLRDSIFQINSIQKVREVEVIYKTKEIETKNEFLEKENKLVKSRNQTIFTALIIVILILSLLGFTFYKLRLSNIDLERKREEISLLIDQKDEYMRIVAHDLKSPFDSYLGLANILNYLLRKGQYDRITQISDQIDHVGARVSLVLNNLLSWSNTNTSENNRDKTKNLFLPLINQIYPLYESLAELREIQFDVRLNVNDSHIMVNKQEVDTIFRNILDNALKNTRAGCEISITGVESESKIVLIVRNSFSVDSDLADATYAMSFLNGLHAQKERGRSGLGLVLIRQFAKDNQIELSASLDGDYFQVTLSFPKINP